MTSLQPIPPKAIKVLIIEDDPDVGEALEGSLERSGVTAAWAQTGNAGLALKGNFSPDVILVDLNLPDMDGIGLVKALAEDGDCGIIIVSGLSDEADRIVGLEVGADDYVTKPPHPRELQARIRAVHRRVTMRAVARADPSRALIQLGGIQVDLAGRALRFADGRKTELTGAEFSAFELMLAADGAVVSRDRLSETALRRPWRAEDRSVDQLIFGLRQKLASDGSQHIIHSIRGQGYLLSAALPRDDCGLVLGDPLEVSP